MKLQRLESRPVMPHAVYFAASMLCPWPGCGYGIAMIDFQLERLNDPLLYARVMKDWGSDPEFGLIGRSPGCRDFVLFTSDRKVAVTEPLATGLPVLPDNWHDNSCIVQ